MTTSSMPRAFTRSRNVEPYAASRSRIGERGSVQSPNASSNCLQPQEVTRFVGWRKAAKTSNRTINRDLAVLSHMLHWGVREHYLARNPVPDIQKLREVEWVGPRPTVEIIDAVFAQLGSRVVPLFTFIRETGCRREEALSLRHRQIDFARREVVYSTITPRTESTGGCR